MPSKVLFLSIITLVCFRSLSPLKAVKSLYTRRRKFSQPLKSKKIIFDSFSAIFYHFWLFFEAFEPPEMSKKRSSFFIVANI
jgi:hypothetical protein